MDLNATCSLMFFLPYVVLSDQLCHLVILVKCAVPISCTHFFDDKFVSECSLLRFFLAKKATPFWLEAKPVTFAGRKVLGSSVGQAFYRIVVKGFMHAI